MKHVLNETKAKEIAKSNGINYKNHSKYEDDMDSTLECYKSAIEAMAWKDEQHEQEKQQIINNAVEWLNKYFYLNKNIIDNFKQAMKGE